jgi:putative heme-binding domain-containing protein
LSLLAREAKEPGAILNALYTLQALGTLSRDDAAAALEHSNAEVRQNALHFAEPWLDTRPGLLDQVFNCASASDPAVLLQLALTLGESKDSRVPGALAALAREHGDLNWMPNAILSSLPDHSGAMLAELLGKPEGLGQAKALLEPLGAAAGSRHDAQELTQTLKSIASVHDPALELVCLRGLQTGLKRVRSIAINDDGREALNQLLASENTEVRRLATRINEVFQRADPATQRKLFANAAREVADFQLPVETRLAAVALLASSDDTKAAPILLAAWSASTPKVRDAILDAIFSRSDRLPELVKALEQKTLPPSALTAFQRQSLLENEQPAMRDAAAKLLVRTSGAGDEAFQQFTAALRAPRDRVNGEKIFRDNCAPCHKVRGIGFNVGPDLGAEFQRAEDAILKDVLAPNDTISAGYPTFAVETKDGDSFSGLLASESATSVTLRRAGGLDQVILRKDIARLNSLQVSMMPEGFDKILKPKDAADVIAWLRDPGAQPAAPQASRLVLFEDEPEFLANLNQGDGHGILETSGSFSGQACIAVTSGQRFSGQIPGWRYRIAEKQAPGNFRYLRLAWKAPEAAGVLIELAADGHWPSPSESKRRYFAGRNTTPWQARQVSPESPAEWRVVTFDLWKDCGQFNLTGIALTAMGGTAFFDRIELTSEIPRLANVKAKK